MSEPLYPGEVAEIELFVTVVDSDLAVSAAAGATAITVYDPSRWAANDWLKIGDGHPQYSTAELVQIDSITGKVVTLKSATPLAWGHGIGTPVYQLSNSTLAGIVDRPASATATLTINAVSTGRYRATHATAAADQGSNVIEITSSVQVIATAVATFEVLTDAAS